MSKLKPWFAALFILACFFAASKHALADTYQIINLGTDQAVFFYGMDDTGTVVLNFTNSVQCGGSTNCYYTFIDGAVSSYSSTAPSLAFDNGTPCSPAVPPGGSVIRGVCNGDLDAFTGRVGSGQGTPGVYAGSYPDITDLANGGGGAIYLNSIGDIVWDDTYSEYWYLAIDTSSVPEPGSFLLLGTGALAAFGAIRRRLYS